jgi:hypothetical protein
LRRGVAAVPYGTVGVGFSAVGITGTGTASLMGLASGNFLPIAVGVPMTIRDQHPTAASREENEQGEPRDEKRFHLTLMTFPSLVFDSL